MTQTAENYNELHATLNRAHQQINEIVLGKEHEIRLALACLLADGHLLIEDIPGVGKTTLAHSLAKVMGLEYTRIQFTSDLLPADIIGVSIYNQQNNQFEFHPGPIFSQLILADEINRATPKAQSALLEAMEEHQVSVENQTRPLPKPFFVIATQNPQQQIGTFPIPESQLDRFTMKMSLGYPNAEAERSLLSGRQRKQMLRDVTAVFDTNSLLNCQKSASQIFVAPELMDYLLAILDFTRQGEHFVHGLSPRAGQALLRCAQSWALLDGRDHALPEDIQAVLPSVAAHRLQSQQHTLQQTIELLFSVAIP